jgi:hypothetical protein
VTEADRWYEARIEPGPPATIDTTVANQARVYDYWLGGKDNYRVDRLAGDRYLRVVPEVRPGVRAQRAFMQRAVQFMAAEEGVRQFLDIGTGLPTSPNVHEVAQGVAPEARVVYVDNDPSVLAHARALLTSGTGRTAYLDADLRDTETILREAPRLLEFQEPIGLLLIGILQLVPDEDKPGIAVRRLVEALPSGSWLAILQPTADVPSEALRRNMRKAVSRLNSVSAVPTTMRSRDAIRRFFDGTALMDPPGVVQVHRWRPSPGAADLEKNIPAYAGLGRKP